MTAFRFLTGGESHGPALSMILEGLPANLPIDFEEVNRHLKRRQGGYGRGARQQIESDRIEILSGVRFGRTMGGPVTLLVRNRDFENWRDRMSVEPVAEETPPITQPRPGHADFPGMLKYHSNDLRPILERSSARNTAALVAGGAICRHLLQHAGIEIMSHVVMIGGVWARFEQEVNYRELAERAEQSPVRCADPEAEARMIAAIDRCMQEGTRDTLGGVFEVVALGCPPGLGSFVHWDRKLDARLAAALMSIQAIKGVEVGLGFGVAEIPGSRVHDELFFGVGEGFTRGTNNAGGIEGGMTNGEPVVVRAAMKPLSTLPTPLSTVDMVTRQAVKAHFERSDVCAVPAAAVVGEAMVALTLTGAVLEKFGGDSLEEFRRNVEAYMAEVRERGFLRKTG
ncbi:MAG: chorismate synthase [Chloroherpetonaceae bacterium]|nr:chorismate synthase [Chthonomonadaceae bacterium]MDW8208597.1 chorismate synthase [Chloroherpetonaceae bacterium]